MVNARVATRVPAGNSGSGFCEVRHKNVQGRSCVIASRYTGELRANGISMRCLQAVLDRASSQCPLPGGQLTAKLNTDCLVWVDRRLSTAGERDLVASRCDRVLTATKRTDKPTTKKTAKQHTGTHDRTEERGA